MVAPVVSTPPHPSGRPNRSSSHRIETASSVEVSGAPVGSAVF
jgi:hypothetical protein